MEKFDLIIIGAGPAGMTAAVYAGRKGTHTLVLSMNIGGQVNWTTNVENYMGFKEISGLELMERFEEQMKGPYVQYHEEKVTKVEKNEDFFTVTTERNIYQGKTVILATGKRPRMLNVLGEKELRGKGVSYCSTCDAPLFAKLPVAVVGGGNSAYQAVIDLAEVAQEIHLLLMEEPKADQVLQDRISQIPIVKWHENVVVKEIKGDKAVQKVIVEKITTREQYTLGVEGIFIEIGLEPNIEPFMHLVTKNYIHEVMVDCRCQTNIDGLLAAGDVTNVQEKQIIVAAGEGAKAALSAVDYLIYQKRLPCYIS